MSNANSIDSTRVGLLLDASYEVDKIARVLPNLVTMDDDQTHYAVRAMAGRLLRLTSILISGLGDDDFPIEKMERVLSFEGSSQG